MTDKYCRICLMMLLNGIVFAFNGVVRVAHIYHKCNPTSVDAYA